MPVVDVYNLAKDRVSELTLSDEVFGVEVKNHLFHTVVRYQLALRRAGTHAAKTRSWISGGGKKPWRQKGTGRARQGSTRSPQWRGGGVVFGPVTRSHAIGLPKRVRRLALKGALSRRASEQAVVVVDNLEFSEWKTRQFAAFMDRFALKSILVVTPAAHENVSRIARNIPGVTVVPAVGLNVYDVLRHNGLVLTVDAVRAIEGRLLEGSNG